jgi:hypothetical protein
MLVRPAALWTSKAHSLVRPVLKVQPAPQALKVCAVPPVRQARAFPVLPANRVLPVALVSGVQPERGAPQEMWKEDALE